MENYIWEWEEEEKIIKLKVGDFVGDPGWDWDLSVLWPCVVTNIVNDETVVVAECLSYRIEDKRQYRKKKIDKLKIWSEETQLKYYKRLKKRHGGSEKWLEFIDKHKKYE